MRQRYTTGFAIFTAVLLTLACLLWAIFVQ
jgi:hypothetical protein